MGTIYGLITLPATDGNWISHSKSATLDELIKAEEFLLILNAHEKGNKSSLASVQKEIKRRKNKNMKGQIL